MAQDTEKESLQQLIESLADPLPSVRSKAEIAIFAAGDEAIPFVKDGLQNGNLEIHNRCRILLEKLESQRRERLSKIFLEAPEGDESLNQFPAWLKFRDFVDDRSVLRRKLFLEMCDGIPLVFENHDFKVEQNSAAFKQAARLVLVKDKHPASWDALLIAYLFLYDSALKSKEGEEPLFNSVEVLEGVNSISHLEHARVVKSSKYRKIVDGSVARWIKSNNDEDQIPEDSIFNLAFATANPFMIDEIVLRYDQLDRKKKLHFFDIVSQATIGKKGVGIDRCVQWLEKALADESILVDSRFRKRPAEKIEVSAKMLAETLLAGQFNKDVENQERIDLEQVFGIFPRSGRGISIIQSEKARNSLSEKIRIRVKQSETVE